MLQTHKTIYVEMEQIFIKRYIFTYVSTVFKLRYHWYELIQQLPVFPFF